MTAPATDPFAQFQTGASYIGPGGVPIQGATQAPTGTPFYASAPLVQNADGSTRSTAATATNQFAGFVDAEGGGFGSSGIVDDPTATGAAAGTLNGQPIGAGLTRAQATALQVGQDDATSLLNDPNEQQALASASPAWFASLSPQMQAQMVGQGYTPPAAGSSGPTTAQFLAANPTEDPSSTLYQPPAAPASASPAVTPLADGSTPQNDPFGQFASPTAGGGVITPANEAAMAAQSQANLLAETQPGAIAASPLASATQTPTAPEIAAPSSVTAAAPTGPGGVSTADPFAPPGNTGTVDPSDPFAPFVNPTTGLPITGAAPSTSSVQSPTFAPSTTAILT